MKMKQLLLAILITFFLPVAQATCPSDLSSICRCTRLFTGFDLDCSYMNYTDVVAALTARKLNAPIAKLKLSKSTIPVLKPRSFHGLVIHILDLSNVGMQRIEEDALIGQVPDLSQLILANNSLISIPSFRNYDQLKVIDLSGNQLSEVPPGIFTALPNLQHLKLGRNQICSLAKAALGEVKQQLTLLDLASNCLPAVPAQNIRGFTELSWLDLSGNAITQLGDLQFVNMPELKDVFLEDNQIRTIGQLAFMNIPKLNSLSLRNNALTTLSANRFQSFLNLETLDLRNNQLDRLGPSSFRDMEKLQQLLLDDNRIEKVDTFAFSNNPRLKIVSLQNNKISEIGPNAFDGHNQLTYLMFTNNSLSGITQDMLSGMPNLQQLGLRHNVVSRLAAGSFALVPGLTNLDLGQNRLRTLQAGVFTDMPKLFWLDLSHNRIARVEQDTFIYKIPNILIHGNPLVCDDQMDWFVSYLVKHNVRIFLPKQKDITCAGPEKFKGTRLKDLLLRKANQTLFRSMNGFMDPQTLQTSIANTAISGYLKNANPELLKNLAISNKIPLDKLVPGLNAALPGISGLPAVLTQVPLPAGVGREIGPSLSKFTGPIAKLAVGEPPQNLASDVSTMIQNLPGLVSSLPAAPLPPSGGGNQNPHAGGGLVPTGRQGQVPQAAGGAPISIPGFAGLTLDKLSPSLIQYALKGGKIPGVPDSVVQSLLQQYLRQQSAVVAPRQSVGRGQAILPGASNVNNPLQSGPQHPVQRPPTNPQVFQAGNFVGAPQQGQNPHHGTMPDGNGFAASGPRIITGMPPSVPAGIDSNPPATGLVQENSVAGAQPTLDLTGLSPEIIKSLSQGKLPDLRKHPEFIQTLQENPGLLSVLEDTQNSGKRGDRGSEGGPGGSGRDGSNYVRNGHLTSDRNYDIDELVKKANSERSDQSNALLITGISLGVIGALTLVTLATLCYRRRRSSSVRSDDTQPADSLFYGTGIPSVGSGSPPKIASSGGGLGPGPGGDFENIIDFTHRGSPTDQQPVGPNMTSSSQALVYDTINWPNHGRTGR